MDFNEKLVDIILNEKYDGEKDIDWLYGEYVKRGYNKCKEMFCEEFVMSMNEQEIKYLTESEVNKVTGGAGKFKKSSTSIALASALLVAPMVPTQGAGVKTPRTMVSDSISNKHQGKSRHGFYEKATGILNKIFNEADVRNILVPVLGTVAMPVLEAGSIYLTSRIVKRISEAKTPEAVLKNTAETIKEILDGGDKTGRTKKDVLTTLASCLLELIKFVPENRRNKPNQQFESKFGTKEKSIVFSKWEGLETAFTEVFEEINKVLKLGTENGPLNRLFEERKNN